MKTPKMFFLWKKNVRSFHKYSAAVNELAFSVKFPLENERMKIFEKYQMQPLLY